MSAALNTAAMAAMLLKVAEPLVAYLVDAEGRTVGGPTRVKGSRVVKGQIEVDVAVPARTRVVDGMLRLYGADGPIMQFDVRYLDAGCTASPPPFGFTSV